MRRFPAPDALLLEIDGFAALCGDCQWIHQVEPRADHGPYGGTITHDEFASFFDLDDRGVIGELAENYDRKRRIVMLKVLNGQGV